MKPGPDICDVQYFSIKLHSLHINKLDVMYKKGYYSDLLTETLPFKEIKLILLNHISVKRGHNSKITSRHLHDIS